MDWQEALAAAKREFCNTPNITGVGWGLPVRAGARGAEPCLIVYVREKLSPDALAARPDIRAVPRAYEGFPTDVQQTGEIVAFELTAKRRPCPPGFSIGHERITAGTLGCYARRLSGEIVVVSNNHVLADSNAAVAGDVIRQPGRADGGTQDDRFARLTDFARINFPATKKAATASRLWWGTFRGVANAGARLVGCRNRLVLVERQSISPAVVNQPTPNVVDAAVATPLAANFIDPTFALINRRWMAIARAELSDRVEKVGRTTEHTVGRVVGVGARIQVSYGTSGTAEFDDQVHVEADAGNFSQGGDSGSAILRGTTLVALLFAGGGTATFANQMPTVFELLGLDTTPPFETT
jgi:hypothetical protein